LNATPLRIPTTPAAPVESLADFVSKVQPWLAQSLFSFATNRSISPGLTDVYPKFAPAPAAGSLQFRGDEPAEIKALHEKAQTLAHGMRNLVAVQTLGLGVRHK
jgi:hypothetical protein